MTDLYALKRYESHSWGWVFVAALFLSLSVWGFALYGIWKAFELFLQRVGLGG